MRNKIKEIRLAQQIGQRELARLVGVSAPFMHDLECGNRNAKPETMQKIANALGCTVADLKAGERDGAAS